MARLLEWYGKEVMKKVQDATVAGINETMLKCSSAAQSQLYPGHGVITGILKGSIKPHEDGVTVDGNSIVGRWGSHDVNYALPIEARYGYLRYAVDTEYPGLAKRIQEHLDK